MEIENTRESVVFTGIAEIKEQEQGSYAERVDIALKLLTLLDTPIDEETFASYLKIAGLEPKDNVEHALLAREISLLVGTRLVTLKGQLRAYFDGRAFMEGDDMKDSESVLEFKKSGIEFLKSLNIH